MFGKVMQDIGKFYQYVETGRSGDALTKRIDEAVHEARKREEWRSDYMKERVIIMDAIEEERQNTERERKRADEAESRANSAEAELEKARKIISDYKAKEREATKPIVTT